LSRNEDLVFKENEIIRIAHNILEALNYLQTNSHPETFILKPEDLVVDHTVRKTKKFIFSINFKGNVQISFYGLGKYQSLQNHIQSHLLFVPPEMFLLSDQYEVSRSNFGYKVTIILRLTINITYLGRNLEPRHIASLMPNCQ